MCGIVGAVTERNVTPILMEGLRRLEYRGYDSAGLAVLLDTDHSSGKTEWYQWSRGHSPYTMGHARGSLND